MIDSLNNFLSSLKTLFSESNFFDEHFDGLLILKNGFITLPIFLVDNLRESRISV